MLVYLLKARVFPTEDGDIPDGDEVVPYGSVSETGTEHWGAALTAEMETLLWGICYTSLSDTMRETVSRRGWAWSPPCVRAWRRPTPVLCLAARSSTTRSSRRCGARWRAASSPTTRLASWETDCATASRQDVDGGAGVISRGGAIWCPSRC